MKLLDFRFSQRAGIGQDSFFLSVSALLSLFVMEAFSSGHRFSFPEGPLTTRQRAEEIVSDPEDRAVEKKGRLRLGSASSKSGCGESGMGNRSDLKETAGGSRVPLRGGGEAKKTVTVAGTPEFLVPSEEAGSAVIFHPSPP